MGLIARLVACSPGISRARTEALAQGNYTHCDNLLRSVSAVDKGFVSGGTAALTAAPFITLK